MVQGYCYPYLFNIFLHPVVPNTPPPSEVNYKVYFSSKIRERKKMYHFAPISADEGESNLFTTLSNVFSDEQIIKLSQVEDYLVQRFQNNMAHLYRGIPYMILCHLLAKSRN
jgi:hypothetical protein